MDRNSFEFIQDVIITIHANIRDLKDRKSFAEADEIPYIDGKLQAYSEMLSLLKSSAEEFDIPFQDLGL